MKWIRLWPDYIINGTTFAELDAEARGVWFSFLALAGYSPVPGTICIAEGVPYTREQIAAFLKIPLKIVNRAVDRLAGEEVQKIILNADGTISICNWHKYQSEYERQKPYRRGLQGKVTKKGYSEKLQVETETDTEEETKTEPKIKDTVEQARPTVAEQAREVFAHWQTELHHPQSKLDAKRERVIRARLKEGYTVDRIKQAIRGIKRSPHHMGQNDRNTIYDDIELICRSGTNVDRFAEMEGRKSIHQRVNVSRYERAGVLQEATGERATMEKSGGVDAGAVSGVEPR